MTLQGGPTHYPPYWLATLSSCLLPTRTIPIKRTHLLPPVTIVFGLLDPEKLYRGHPVIHDLFICCV